MNTFTEKVDNTFLFIAGISVVLLFLITFFMVFFVIKYNRKKNPEATDIEGNSILETIWILVPTVLVLAMFYSGWTGFKIISNAPSNSMNVKVIARMWSWLFEYENGKQSSELYVPVNMPVKLNLVSLDVIHSFYIPAFRIKQDAVPGLKTSLWFSANKTGTFDILCAEYCGEKHSAMLSKVIVISESEFDKWYGEKEKIAEAGEAKLSIEDKQKAGSQFLDTKGCLVCHSLDGSESIGPTFKGIFGKKIVVITNKKEREITADENYLIKSILEPNVDIVKGYDPVMPPQEDLLKEEELKTIVEYLKNLK